MLQNYFSQDSNRKLGRDPTKPRGRLKSLSDDPIPNRSKPPWHSIKSPVKAVTSGSSLPSLISVGRPLLLHQSHRPSLSPSSLTWAVPKPSPQTFTSTASPPSSSKPVKPTAPPATNPPYPAAKVCCRAPPPNPPGR